MSQATLDDDLFDEAASEVRTDVESSLAAARADLPAPDAVWTVDAENTLGVLNGLRSALDVDGAADHLREAKKWYAMGERAGAFDEDDELAEDLEAVAALLVEVETAREQVGELTTTIPQLRNALEEAADGDGEEAADAEAEADADSEGGAEA